MSIDHAKLDEGLRNCTPDEKFIAKLAVLGLSADQIVSVLAIKREMDAPRRAAQRERTARRRARVNVRTDEWYSLREQVFERDGFVCAYCGDAEGPHQIDHIVPVVQGGASVLDNLCVACRACNASKGGQTPEEWQFQ